MDTLLEDRGLHQAYVPAYAPVLEPDADAPADLGLPVDFEARKLALHYAMQMGGADPVAWFRKFHKLLTEEGKKK